MKNDPNHDLQVETGQSYFHPTFMILAAIQHHLMLLRFLELWSHLTAFSVPTCAMYKSSIQQQAPKSLFIFDGFENMTPDILEGPEMRMIAFEVTAQLGDQSCDRF